MQLPVVRNTSRIGLFGDDDKKKGKRPLAPHTQGPQPPRALVKGSGTKATDEIVETQATEATIEIVGTKAGGDMARPFVGPDCSPARPLV